MDIENIGGYPVNITGLAEGDILFFDGVSWKNITRFATPTLYALQSPSGNPTVLFDGIQVIINNLQPGDVLIMKRYGYQTWGGNYFVNWFWTNYPRPDPTRKRLQALAGHREQNDTPLDHTAAHAISAYDTQLI